MTDRDTPTLEEVQQSIDCVEAVNIPYLLLHHLGISADLVPDVVKIVAAARLWLDEHPPCGFCDGKGRTPPTPDEVRMGAPADDDEFHQCPKCGGTGQQPQWEQRPKKPLMVDYYDLEADEAMIERAAREAIRQWAENDEDYEPGADDLAIAEAMLRAALEVEHE